MVADWDRKTQQVIPQRRGRCLGSKLKKGPTTGLTHCIVCNFGSTLPLPRMATSSNVIPSVVTSDSRNDRTDHNHLYDKGSNFPEGISLEGYRSPHDEVTFAALVTLLRL